MEETNTNITTDSLAQTPKDTSTKGNSKKRSFFIICAILSLLLVGICVAVVVILMHSHSHTVLTPEAIRNYCVENGLIIQESGDGMHENDSGAVYALSCEEDVSDEVPDLVAALTIKKDVFLIRYAKYNKPSVETEMMSFSDSNQPLVDDGNYKKYYLDYNEYESTMTNSVAYTVFDENIYLHFYARNNKCAKDFLLSLGYPDDKWGVDKKGMGGTSNKDISYSLRNSQRRDDLAKVITSLVNYQANNRGMLPKGPSYWKGSSTFDCGDGAVSCSFVENYLSSDSSVNSFKDPSGKYYSLFITDDLSEGEITTSYGSDNSKLVKTDSGYTIGGYSPFDEHVIYIVPGATCDGNTVIKSTSKRKAALLYMLENYGVYCGHAV